MTLEVKKIYVDSRFCTPDSNSNSDFKIQLSRNIYLPENCVMHIENITLPHAWYSIEAGINDKIYVKLGTTYYIATIPSTNYNGATFATAVSTALGNGFSVAYEVNTNRLTISNSQSFKILTDTELSTGYSGAWTGPVYNWSLAASVNDIIANLTPNSGYSLVSGMLSLNGFRAVYLSSSTLSNYNTLGAKGENNIIRKIASSADFGYQIIDQMVSDHDFLPVGNITLNTIDFQVKDVKGSFVPFRGSHISFTIKFTIRKDQ